MNNLILWRVDRIITGPMMQSYSPRCVGRIIGGKDTPFKAKRDGYVFSILGSFTQTEIRRIIDGNNNDHIVLGK